MTVFGAILLMEWEEATEATNEGGALTSFMLCECSHPKMG